HKDASERYDYEYSREELAEWVRHLRDLAGRTRLTFIFMTNCRLWKSAKDAIKLMDLLELPLPEDRLLGEEEKRLFT
ncbi:MAG: DUF72 domain-containing protein, partial [Candidatus Bathyarchaeia archaeon]